MIKLLRKVVRRVVVVVVASLAFAGSAAAAPTVEDFANNPVMSAVRISPGGDYLAWIGTVRGLPALVTFNLSRGEIIHTWTSTDEAIGPQNSQIDWIGEGSDQYQVENFRWLNNERLLVTLSFPRPRVFYGQRFHAPEVRLLAVDVDGTNGVLLFNQGSDAQAPQYSDPYRGYVDEQTILAVFSRLGPQNLYRVNTQTGTKTQVAEGESLSYGYQTCGWIANPTGEIAVRRECDSNPGVRYSARNPSSGQWELLRESNPIGENVSELDFFVESVAEDGTIYVLSSHEGRAGLYRMEAGSPNDMEEVFLHSRYDVQGTQYDRYTGHVLSVMYVDEFPNYVYFDPLLEQLVTEVSEATSGEVTTVVSMTQDRNQIALVSYGDREPPVYSMVDLRDGSYSIISATRPGIDPDELGARERLEYTARDGLALEAIVNYPPNHDAESRSLPLVVLPHGGPYGPQDDASFDSLAQFIASRGYLVIQPNFRGSGGYGNDFIADAFNKWGEEMQDDVTDAALRLVDLGLADRDRICIAGWSYGAYAALQGVSDGSDAAGLYKCAIGINGVYNLLSILTEDEFTGFREYWDDALGHPATDGTRLFATSPELNVENIEVPVLIVYGQEDPIVPYQQGEDMFDALSESRTARELGLQHVEVDIPTGDHSMFPEADRVRTFEAVGDFLAQHLEPVGQN